MRWRDRTSMLFGGAAVAAAILVIGGALRWSQALVAVLAALALIPHVWSRRVLARKSPLVVLLGTAVVLTAIQLVPLPRSILAALDPTGAALRDDAATLMDVSPWEAITRDAPGTLAALAFFVILTGVAIVGLRMSTTERGRFHVLACVGALTAVTALVVAIHELLGATSLYGLYEPEHATPPLLGPLLNTNHLGGLTAVGAVVSIGLMMYVRQPPWMRVGWLVTAIGCSIVTVATLSRGATVSLVVGAGVALGTIGTQRLANTESSRRRRSRFLTTSLPIGVVATCTVLIVVLSSAGGVQRELSRTSLDELSQTTSKYAAWQSATGLVSESPWVGIGRGAFEASFTRVHPASGQVTFSHLENEYLQAVVDWGIPGAVCLALAALWLVIVAVKRWRDGPLAAGALGACTVIALQSNFDFGLELLGLAVPMTAIAATLTYVPLREATAGSLAVARIVRVVHVAVIAGAALVLATSITTSVDEDHRMLSSETATLADARVAIERHPLDYYAYARASALMTGQDARAIRVLNHALTLHPTHPGLHRMAGRLLLQARHVDQAAIEYATALRVSQNPQKLIAEIIAVFPEDKVAAAIPTDFPRVDLVIRILREQSRSDLASAWLTRVLAARPKDVRACELLYEIALRDDNLEAAEMGARICVELVPDRGTRLALARVLMRKHNYAEVVRLLHDVDSWSGRINDKVAGWLALCDAHEGLGKLDDAKRCLRQLDLSGYVPGERRSDLLKRIERIEKTKREQALDSARLSGAGKQQSP